jgi:hypothetical protein
MPNSENIISKMQTLSSLIWRMSSNEEFQFFLNDMQINNCFIYKNDKSIAEYYYYMSQVERYCEKHKNIDIKKYRQLFCEILLQD